MLRLKAVPSVLSASASSIVQNAGNLNKPAVSILHQAKVGAAVGAFVGPVVGVAVGALVGECVSVWQ